MIFPWWLGLIPFLELAPLPTLGECEAGPCGTPDTSSAQGLDAKRPRPHGPLEEGEDEHR